MIDVDCLKQYNDLYGHAAGDECLRKVCRVIAEADRRPGDLSARYGGEEMAVLLPNTDVAGALAVAEMIRTQIAALALVHEGIIYRSQGNLQGAFDSLRVHQLATNLLINAAQYARKDTEVVMQAEGLVDKITVRVSNFGPVIAPDALKTIFQPLVQLDPDAGVDARPNTSLGLGLFIAQEAAFVHDAAIAVTSSEAEGTVFTVTFPRDTAT